MARKNYTVLIGYPKGGGHYTSAGDTVDLLDVQARALRQAGRIRLTADIEAEAAAAAAVEVEVAATADVEAAPAAKAKTATKAKAKAAAEGSE
jgi:hypothetical protein